MKNNPLLLSQIAASRFWTSIVIVATGKNYYLLLLGSFLDCIDILG